MKSIDPEVNETANRIGARVASEADEMPVPKRKWIAEIFDGNRGRGR